MGFLRRISDGAVTTDLDPSGVEYQTLADLRDPTNAAKVLWEDIPEEDLAGVTSRVLVVSEPGAAIAADETVSGVVPKVGGTITNAVFVANSPGIVGANTNSRTITAQQVTMAGTATPTRAVTVLLTLALTAGVNAPANQNSAAFTINQAAFVNREPIQVVSTHIGTGIVDPGGLVVITYTPA